MDQFLQGIKKSIKNRGARIAFPESTDLRILQAINQLLIEGYVSEILLFASRKEILHLAKNNSFGEIVSKQESLVCIDEDLSLSNEDLLLFLRERMSHKPVNDSALTEMAVSPLYRAGYLLAQGRVDCVLAGAVTETSHVIRAAIRTVGKADGVQTLSGSFLMQRKNEVYLFADCGVTIEPTLEELVDIAIESKNTWNSIPSLAKQELRMAFLSFSTKGSAKHRSCLKMEQAAQLVKLRDENILVDGELQFDAAFDLEVGERKAPGSPVAGRANVFIFPDLNAANIAYKITQRLGGFSAYGPLLQGLRKPYSDLSRGASVHDIVVCSYINLLRAQARD